MTGITAVAVQLTSTTRGAGGIAIAALGLAFVVRAMGDTSSGNGQDLVYASFLGWAQQVSPFGENRLWWLVPVAILLLLLAVADVLLQRRDLGSGLWAARPGRSRASAQLG